MNKKKIIMVITAMSIISMGMLSACGKKESTDKLSENTNVAEDLTADEKTEVKENAGETEETVEEESSFGLKDYEGFYYMTATDEIEGYEVTYTWGYQLNGDGTGMYYGQDVIDITWNETEIRNGEYTETYTMEPGKLTVNGITYNKIEGNFITPNPCEVDVNNIDNGIYHAYMAESGIDESNGSFTINTEILTEDTYDIVDINRMTEGDAIYINRQLLYINSIDENSFGIININGGIENFGSALIADDESNCFVYVGMDMERSYTSHGMTPITISDDAKFIDKKDLSEVKEYTGNNAEAKLKEILKEEPLNCYNCVITIEDGEIVEIDRLFVP